VAALNIEAKQIETRAFVQILHGQGFAETNARLVFEIARIPSRLQPTGWGVISFQSSIPFLKLAADQKYMRGTRHLPHNAADLSAVALGRVFALALCAALCLIFFGQVMLHLSPRCQPGLFFYFGLGQEPV
jgi:hypothetical protein